MKLLLIGASVGLVVGVGLTIFCFSLAYLFAVNARAPDTFANQRVAEKGSEEAGSATVTGKKRGVGA